MSSADSLIGVGLPAEVAKRAGYDLATATTSASTQASAGGNLRGAGNKVVQATITTAADALTLPADSGLLDEVIISNMGANAAVVFPHVGGNVNGGSANASVALAANATRRFVKVTALKWASWISG